MTHNKIIDLLKTSCLSEKVVLVCTRPHESNKNEMNDDHSSLPSLRSYHGESIETSKSSTTIESSSNKDANNNNNFKMQTTTKTMVWNNMENFFYDYYHIQFPCCASFRVLI